MKGLGTLRVEIETAARDKHHGRVQVIDSANGLTLVVWALAALALLYSILRYSSSVASAMREYCDFFLRTTASSIGRACPTLPATQQVTTTEARTEAQRGTEREWTCRAMEEPHGVQAAALCKALAMPTPSWIVEETNWRWRQESRVTRDAELLVLMGGHR